MEKTFDLKDYVDEKYSWWIAFLGELTKVNDTNPSPENIRIIYLCSMCNEVHVVQVQDIKLHEDGYYDLCCPKYNLKKFCGENINPEEIPEELKEVFLKTSFEKNY